MSGHWRRGSIPTRSSRQPCGTNIPNRMITPIRVVVTHARNANAAAGGDRVPSCPRPAGSAVLADACGGEPDEAAGAGHRPGGRGGVGGGGGGGGAAGGGG